MSFTYDYNDSETSESFELPHVLGHDDLETAVEESDNPIPNIRKGLAGVHDLPVSLRPGHFLCLLAHGCTSRCRASDAHVVLRRVLSSGCFRASIVPVAISLARLWKVRDASP